MSQKMIYVLCYILSNNPRTWTYTYATLPFVGNEPLEATQDRALEFLQSDPEKVLRVGQIIIPSYTRLDEPPEFCTYPNLYRDSHE